MSDVMVPRASDQPFKLDWQKAGMLLGILGSSAAAVGYVAIRTGEAINRIGFVSAHNEATNIREAANRVILEIPREGVSPATERSIDRQISTYCAAERLKCTLGESVISDLETLRNKTIERSDAAATRRDRKELRKPFVVLMKAIDNTIQHGKPPRPMTISQNVKLSTDANLRTVLVGRPRNVEKASATFA